LAEVDNRLHRCAGAGVDAQRLAHGAGQAAGSGAAIRDTLTGCGERIGRHDGYAAGPAVSAGTGDQADVDRAVGPERVAADIDARVSHRGDELRRAIGVGVVDDRIAAGDILGARRMHEREQRQQGKNQSHVEPLGEGSPWRSGGEITRESAALPVQTDERNHHQHLKAGRRDQRRHGGLTNRQVGEQKRRDRRQQQQEPRRQHRPDRRHRRGHLLEVFAP